MGISRPSQVKTRTATKLAAEKLRAQDAAAQQSATNVDSCGQGMCGCSHGQIPPADAVGQLVDITADASFHNSASNCNTSDGSSTVGNGRAVQQHQPAMRAACDPGCDCTAASQRTNGVVCASNEDWSLPSNFTDASDVEGAQAGDVQNTFAALSVGGTDKGLSAEVPARVHGKLYESNLREVDAHPSARRPVRADFGTSW